MTPQALLLSAGESSRTWPISEKIFFRFFGKTILEYQIHTILESGIKNIHIVGNKNNMERIQMICKNISQGNFSFSIQKNLSYGQRGGILSSEKETDLNSPLIIICSNDIVDSSALKNLLQQARETRSEIYLVSKKVDKYFPGGYLSINGKNKVTHIVEKPEPGTQPSNFVTILLHLYKDPKKLFTALKKIQKGDEYETVLQSLLSQGIQAESVPYAHFWQAIKYPWDFFPLFYYFFKKQKTTAIHPSAEIAKNVSIKENVWISKNVKILDFSTISGPCFIGKNTIIANNTLVRESYIGEDCVIGNGSEVARSILGNNCWTHQNFIGDSIFEENISLGAGTNIGNLRLDEKEILSKIKDKKIETNKQKFGCIIGKNVRIGINTSLMPGIKIGSGNFIGAGVICDRDIVENNFSYQKGSLITKKNKSETLIRKQK
jgi:bifunctional UDP-N-acetylglucosamine pyrophosphorylase/glucosamine-1-phosphate N-acetyltransferase